MKLVLHKIYHGKCVFKGNKLLGWDIVYVGLHTYEYRLSACLIKLANAIKRQKQQIDAIKLYWRFIKMDFIKIDDWVRFVNGIC